MDRLSFVTVTPVIDTAAYANGDRLGAIQEIQGAMSQASGLGSLRNITLVDKDKQKQPITVFFFSDLPVVASADNAALDITDAEMAAKCIGKVEILAADYADMASSSVAVVPVDRAVIDRAGSQSIWAVCAIRGAATYTSTSGLVFSYAFEQVNSHAS